MGRNKSSPKVGNSLIGSLFYDLVKPTKNKYLDVGLTLSEEYWQPRENPEDGAKELKFIIYKGYLKTWHLGGKKKKWREKLSKNSSCLFEELPHGRRYRFILCSLWSRIRSNKKLKGGKFQFNVRRSIDIKHYRMAYIILNSFALKILKQAKCISVKDIIV